MLSTGLAVIPFPLTPISHKRHTNYTACYDHCFGGDINKLGFPRGSVVKNPPANAEYVSSVSGSGRSPGEGNGNLLQYSCLENPMVKRSLVGNRPWGRKDSEPNTT